jgi:hypothetical protein
MFKTQQDCKLAPGIGARIMIFANDTITPPYVVVENKDALNSAAIQYQETFDGSTWSTIVGSSKMIDPGAADGQTVTSSAKTLALYAQGNVLLNIQITRRYSGENTTLN